MSIDDPWLRGRPAKAKEYEWAKDSGTRGAGRLVAKRTKGGASLFYFQYFHNKRRRLLPLGRYAPKGNGGLTVTQARKEATELTRLYRDGVTDLHRYRSGIVAEEIRTREEREAAAKRAEELARTGTLDELLSAYVRRLEEHKDRDTFLTVRSLFRLHLREEFPQLATKRAALITSKEIAEVIRRCVAKGKGRTASTMRSYLHAAYALALNAETDAEIPPYFNGFGIEVNPVSSIKALTAYNTVRERNLSPEELRALLLRLGAMPQDVKTDALRLCLQLGQRPKQLMRIKPEGVDISSGVVTLFDPKGRRKVARVHKVPLLPASAEIFGRRLEERVSDKSPLFSMDPHGVTRMRPQVVSDHLREIVDQMIEKKEISVRFQLRDLRKTCETMLASLGVSMEVRGMILSHGLSGVQKRHYDFYEYAYEMRRALEKWHRHMGKLRTDNSPTVVVAQFGKRRMTR